MAEKKENKNKKISKMSASEIEQALKKSREHNNIHTSKYVQHLQQRLEEIQAAGK
jgi:myo-inositol-1-phosphate synthase